MAFNPGSAADYKARHDAIADAHGKYTARLILREDVLDLLEETLVLGLGRLDASELFENSPLLTVEVRRRHDRDGDEEIAPAPAAAYGKALTLQPEEGARLRAVRNGERVL